MSMMTGYSQSAQANACLAWRKGQDPSWESRTLRLPFSTSDFNIVILASRFVSSPPLRFDERAKALPRYSSPTRAAESSALKSA